MLAHLALALFGGAVFLRIVAKEKNRRYRHLLMRLAEREKAIAEAEEAAKKAQERETAENEKPYEAESIGQAPPVGQAA